MCETVNREVARMCMEVRTLWHDHAQKEVWVGGGGCLDRAVKKGPRKTATLMTWGSGREPKKEQYAATEQSTRDSMIQ